MPVYRFIKNNPLLDTNWSGVSVVGGQNYYVDIEVGSFSIGVISHMESLGFSHHSSSPSDSLPSLATEGLVSSTETSSAYTLALSDMGRSIRRDLGEDNSTKIPLNATVPLPIGFVAIIVMAGVGLSSITKESGVTLNSSNLKVNGKGKALYVHKLATDTWDVIGGVA